MKPYDPAGKCPKCGGAVVSTDYHPSGVWRTGCIREEHQHRYCRRCNYDWIEACLEEKKEGK